jgi:hypothetical protein
MMEEITSTELKQRLDNGDDIQIIDVRENVEVAIGQIPNSNHIPLAQVLTRIRIARRWCIAKWVAAAPARSMRFNVQVFKGNLSISKVE